MRTKLSHCSKRNEHDVVGRSIRQFYVILTWIAGILHGLLWFDLKKITPNQIKNHVLTFWPDNFFLRDFMWYKWSFLKKCLVLCDFSSFMWCAEKLIPVFRWFYVPRYRKKLCSGLLWMHLLCAGTFICITRERGKILMFQGKCGFPQNHIFPETSEFEYFCFGSALLVCCAFRVGKLFG